MIILISFLTLISISLFTFLMTYLTQRYLTYKDLLVVPDLRSSHKEPKPQGGGLSIILVLILSLLILSSFDLVNEDQYLFFLVPGLLVAFIGLLDDFWGIKPLIRISIHFLSASLGIYLIGSFPIISFFEYRIDLGVIGICFGVIYTVWLINLYNFMDGIDGLASLEAISVLSVFSLISYYVQLDSSFSYLLAILTSSIFGFFVLNFPKSKIFMGDVGSGFLGLIIALISIYSSLSHPQLFWSWLILLGVFLVDASLTLLIRIFRGEKFYIAHSSHAYQKMARKLNSHAITSIFVVLINILWLSPIAFLVAFDKIEGILGVLLAYAPLVYLVYYLDANLLDQQDA